MVGFLGEHEATIDAKGRFLLPAAHKRKLPENSPGQFVISRGFEKCLTLYPAENWNPLFENLSKLNEFDPKVREFRRYFLNGATEIELDTAGRLLIPQNLREYANLGRDIMVVGSGKKIEIWDKAKHDEYNDSITAQAFSELAQQVVPNGLEG